LRKASK
jgi:hypothetical protein